MSFLCYAYDMDNSSWQAQNQNGLSNNSLLDTANITNNNNESMSSDMKSNVNSNSSRVNDEEGLTKSDEARYIQELKDNMPKPKQDKPKTKSLKILFAVSITAFLMVAGIIGFVMLSSKSIICRSARGNVTLSYKEDRIVEAKTKDISFDLEGQNKVFKELGKAKYIEEFRQWFKTETGESCKD